MITAVCKVRADRARMWQLPFRAGQRRPPTPRWHPPPLLLGAGRCVLCQGWVLGAGRAGPRQRTCQDNPRHPDAPVEGLEEEPGGACRQRGLRRQPYGAVPSLLACTGAARGQGTHAGSAGRRAYTSQYGEPVRAVGSPDAPQLHICPSQHHNARPLGGEVAEAQPCSKR